jgi:hypothetical protein
MLLEAGDLGQMGKCRSGVGLVGVGCVLHQVRVLLPDTEDAMMAGTTHLLQIARAADAAAALADFLKRHPAAA